jgi:nicotinamidase/pyrazinamidase
LKGIFLLDIDTQRDFMLPSGALYVPGAERLVPKLRRLFDFAKRSGMSILSSVDCHNPEDPEFEEFEPHCIKGTEGQKKLDDTRLRLPLVFENRPVDRNLADSVKKHQQIIVEKQELDMFSNPVTERLLRVLPPFAIVAGVATEYCVKLATLGLRRMNIKAAVLTDVISPIDRAGGEEALREMRRAGAEITTLDNLLNVLQR